MGRIRGIGVAAGIALRAIASPRPEAPDLDRRLAMFVADAPLSAPVAIHWNEHQIPVIETADEGDLAVGVGLVHAHLRLGQIELIRRLATGRAAEIVGPLGLSMDLRTRRHGYDRAVDAIAAGLSPDSRQWIEGFLAGYNHYLTHGPELPPDLRMLGIGREAWGLRDFLTHVRAMSADWSLKATELLLRARDRLAAPEWHDLWQRLLDAGAPAPGGVRGSNAFAVSGARSASGSALIASDPHLDLMLPNLCLVVGLHGPRTRATGLMMPGVPFMPVGRNMDIAWGSTNLYARTTDVFDARGLPMTEATATVAVRGAKPAVLRWRECPLGPIVNDEGVRPHPAPVAMRWMGHAPSDETGALLAVARARDWDGFRAALDGFAVPGLNFVFADTGGRVGQLRAAHVPRGRARRPDDLVLPAAAAWDPLRPATAADLPRVFMPDTGFVVSANEAPPAEGPAIGLFFPPDDRALRLGDLLGRAAPLDIAGLRAIQADVFHAPALAGRDFLLSRLGPGPKPAATAALIGRIAAWDGRYDSESLGATAYEFTLARLVGRVLAKRPLAEYDAIRHSRTLIFRDLAALPAPDLERALAWALAKAAKAMPADARWGAVHAVAPRHPLAALPRIGRHFRAPRALAGGANDTVAKSAQGLVTGRHDVGFGVAARHVSDLGDPDANWFRLLGGQDGWIGSTTATDQIAGWPAGADIQVPLRIETVRRLFTRRLVIRPRRAALSE
ncbi:penicillin acylase family protein [Zavarzinia compransoris]|uniref:penicillin acylase family protein n=1 Tax=Zavarzinia marina TaxID=2911065 RepID=UPI001F1F9D62|nr:penicillin acylase family protein [Zavarzinia marina]MCF4165172.1 penicillin acylase family protein [Zavarzinia marina]